MNVPKELRDALGLQEGQQLIFRLRDDGSAEVFTAASLARRGKGLFAHLKTVKDETADFIETRRGEADT